MFYEITTTITTKVRIGDDGIDGVEHSVAVDGGELAAVLGAQTTMRFVKAGCESAIRAIDAKATKVVVEIDDDEEEQGS